MLQPGAGPLATSDKPPPVAVGNIAERCNVDMDQIPWVVMFVASDRFAGGPVGI